jgi:hypothetical protein
MKIRTSSQVILCHGGVEEARKGGEEWIKVENFFQKK